MTKQGKKRAPPSPTTTVLKFTVILGVVLAALAVAFLASENKLFLFGAVAVAALAVIPLVNLARRMFSENGE